MRRLLKPLIIVLALAAVLLGAGYVLLQNESFLKARIAAFVEHRTGRTLSLDGPLDLQLGRRIVFEAREIGFANADGAAPADMLRIDRLHAVLDLSGLWHGQVVLDELQVERCRLDLAKDASGTANWQGIFPPRAEEDEAEDEPDGSPPPLEVRDARIAECVVSYAPAGSDAPLVLEIDTLAHGVDAQQRATWKGSGRIAEQPWTLSGSIAPVHVLAVGGAMEHELELDVGQVRLVSAGSFEDLFNGAGADLSMRLSGPDIGRALEILLLPPISEGDFDFRANLDTRGGHTRIDVEGDLGSLVVRAKGQLNRLWKPGSGNVELDANGPDLGALGGMFGFEGLVAEPFSLSGAVSYRDSAAEIQRFSLKTNGDTLEASGTVGPPGLYPGTDVTLRLESEDLARWAGRPGLPAGLSGPASLSGRIESDAQGQFQAGTDFELANSTGRIEGPLGRIGDGFRPDLQFTLTSADAHELGAALGVDRLPAAPLNASGRLVATEGKVQLNDWQLDVQDHRARLQGSLGPGSPWPAGQLQAELNSPDLGALGALLGVEGLPGEPVTVDASLDSDGRSLRFRSQQGKVGSLRLEFDGQIPDLEQPLALGMDFDVAVPSLAAIHAFAPRAIVPDLPFAAKGTLQSDSEATRFENIQLTLGDMTGELSGSLANARQFDVQLSARGPDASALKAWTKNSLEAKSFTLDTRIAGDFSGFEFSDIRIQLGDSDASGRLRLDIGELVELSGEAQARRLDLAYWGEWFAAPEEATEKADGQQWVFDDRPVTNIQSHRVRLDLDIRADVVQLPATFLRELELGIHLSPQRLEFKPLSFKGENEGQTSGSFVLDSSPAVPELEAKLQGQAIRLGFFAARGEPIADYPPTDFELQLSAQGATRRAMAASLDGRLRMAVGAGKVASLGASALFSDFLTELLKLLNPFSEREKFTQLDCAYAAADSADGQVTVAPLILHTDALTTLSQGTIDLRTEQIALSFKTKARKGLGISATALINPVINVKGPLAKPSIDLDAASAVVSGGVAVATGGLSILARTVGDRLVSSKDPCGDAQRQIQQRQEQEK